VATPNWREKGQGGKIRGKKHRATWVERTQRFGGAVLLTEAFGGRESEGGGGNGTAPVRGARGKGQNVGKIYQKQERNIMKVPTRTFASEEEVQRILAQQRVGGEK